MNLIYIDVEGVEAKRTTEPLRFWDISDMDLLKWVIEDGFAAVGGAK